MQRSTMQAYVKQSDEAVALYQKAFDAVLISSDLNSDGTFFHSVLDGAFLYSTYWEFGSMIRIRRAEPGDVKEVYELIRTAFAEAEHSDGDEQDLVERLRKSEEYIPDLDLVAVDGKRVVGHILFTRLGLGATRALALAPLAVLPSLQQSGIGTALLQEGHRVACELGFAVSVVLGSEHYYPRVGYQAASLFGIKAPFDVPDENFMALSLQKNAHIESGMVAYAPAFFLKTG